MRHHLLVIAALAAMLPDTANAQLNVAEVSLLVFENQEAGVPMGWTFTVEIDGVGITSATMTPPLRDPIAVPGDSTDRNFESATFASFAALQGDFPPSDPTNKYVIMLNGTTTLVLDFVPVPADDFGAFTSPTDGSATLDTTPTFTVTNACTNCVAQSLFVQGLSMSGPELDNLEFGPPFSTSFDLSDFDPVLAELPLDGYETCIGAANGAIDPDVSNGGQVFDYVHAALAEECIEFNVVPPPDVAEIELAIFEEFVNGGSNGWFFDVFVMGADVLQGTITAPGGGPQDLLPAGPSAIALEVGPFGSLGELQAAFPPSSSGGYTIALNGGVSTVALDFDPLVPDGFPLITSPAPGAVVGPQPSFAFTNSCTNCTEILAELEDQLTLGGLVALEAAFGTPFPSTVDFADFGPNEGGLGDITELPEADYEIVIEAANETVTVETFTPTDDFDLLSGAFRGDAIAFEVPEPGAGALAAVALATLAALKRRRRRGSPKG